MSDSIKVKAASPHILIEAKDLWDDVTVEVVGVVPPAEGEFEPTNEALGSIDADSPKLKVTLPVTGKKFRYAAIGCACTAFKDDVGKVELRVYRDQDAPVPPSFKRPVHATQTLERNAATAPTFLECTFVLELDTP